MKNSYRKIMFMSENKSHEYLLKYIYSNYEMAVFLLCEEECEVSYSNLQELDLYQIRCSVHSTLHLE